MAVPRSEDVDRTDEVGDVDPLAALRALPDAAGDGTAERVRAILGGWPPAVQWGAVVLGLLVVGGVGVLLLRPAPPDPEAVIPRASSVPASSPLPSTTADVPVVAHAAGAVLRPGVYELAAGARVGDLLAAAGGATADADLDRLNLAGPVADGERVWVPRQGELTPPALVAPAPAAGSAGGVTGDDETVNVNTATAEELEALPGVGPTTAAAIVDHRERQGPFVVVEDLLDVRGIGDAKLEQLRDHVAL